MTEPTRRQLLAGLAVLGLQGLTGTRVRAATASANLVVVGGGFGGGGFSGGGGGFGGGGASGGW
mgnify:CR=1 FL=1